MTEPEFDQPRQTPALEEVTAAYQDILQHNTQHSGFGVIFRAAVEMSIAAGPVEAQESPQSDDPTEGIGMGERLTQKTIEGDMDGELQDIFHSDLFMRIGIKVAPFGSRISDGDGEKMTSTSLVPTVDNTELFAEFLGTLKAEDIERDPSNAKLMKDALETMRRTVVLCFGEESQKLGEQEQQLMHEYGEDTLRTFLAIEEHYKRLGLNTTDAYTNNFEALENYVKYWGQNVLPEYLHIGSLEDLAASHAGIFDGMEERYQEKVDWAIGLVGTERTTDFGLEVIKAMISGLESTKKEIEADPDHWSFKLNPDPIAFLDQNIDRLRAIAS